MSIDVNVSGLNTEVDVSIGSPTNIDVSMLSNNIGGATVSGLDTEVDVSMRQTADIDASTGQVILVQDYETLENKPKINGTTLFGNKTSSQIGVADAVHTHTKSDITDFPTLATVATSGAYSDLTGTPSLATVATTGDYDDLLDKPTIPDAVSVTQITSSGTNIADITIGGTTTKLYAPSGGGGASAFVAEFNVTTYADVKDAYDNDAILICTIDDSGNPMVLQFVYFDVANEIFYFAIPMSDGWYLTQLSNADGWDTNQWYFASTDVATQLADGLMSALDKQKLDAIASGAEVNVQSDWSQSDNTKDDFIKNKPTNVSSFVNDAGYLTSFTETDPVFSASDAYGISSSDITNWNAKVDQATGDIELDTSAASGDDYDLTQIFTTLGWLSDITYTP